MIELANSELEANKQKIRVIEDKLKLMAHRKDPDDSKNVVMELRAGTGGDEASIFAGDLLECIQNILKKRLET